MAILFLCTANSCRSQIAEGFLRSIAPEIGVYSAGTRPGRVHPLAIEVMREIGIDISHHASKGIGAVPPRKIETIVTLCEAAATCPTPEIDAERIHWPIDDPVAGSSPEGVLDSFRRVRDEIRAHVLDLARAIGSAD